MNALLILFFLSYGTYALFHNLAFWLIYLSLLGTYYYITQIQLGSPKKEFQERKITIGTWSTPYDPQTYTTVKLNITKIIPYLDRVSKEIGEHITLTVFSIKLMAIVLKKYPEVYGFIRFGRYVPKDEVDVCCLVQVGDGHELANTTIKACEKKSFQTIAKELNENVAMLRERKNKDQNTKMSIMTIFPTFVLAVFSQTLSYLSSIGVTLSFIGLKKYEFGSCVITSIGSIGIEDSFAPIPGILYTLLIITSKITALTFAPMIVTICKKYSKFVFDESNSITEKSFLKLNFTSDYRFFEPKTSAKLMKDIQTLGEDPELFEEECGKCLLQKSPRKKKD